MVRHPVTESEKAWNISVAVNSHPIMFKIDTGASVTAVPENMASRLGRLQASDRYLKGAGSNRLNVTGMARVSMTLGDKTINEVVYVVKGLVTPLLGKPAISKLNLIQFMATVSTDSDWMKKFPALFRGLGTMDSEVHITMEREVEPFTQTVPRRVAAARRAPLRDELERMLRMDVIERVERPTEWCSPCIVVPKPNGKIRVCIDFTKLNKAVKREYHPLPTIEDTLGVLSNAKYFTKLDANSGYWQMKLDQVSQELTTFITPFGRFMCKRLPFGISSAPEIFQREMQKILMGVEGVACHMDDILVVGSNKEDHDERLRRVLQKLESAGVTLNRDKCEFDVKEVKFVGHVINGDGVQADPAKTTAIRDFPTPSNKKELRRFFGIVNYLGKFSPLIASKTASLRQLLGKDSDWCWDVAQAEEFSALKRIMASTPTLCQFDMSKETVLSADASAYGLGVAVLQKEGTLWKPIAYASRALTTAEKRYAQIEKEALAICWGCQKFDYYLSGRRFTVETDHKPLLAVLGDKELAKLPIRIQRFRLRMMPYTYNIFYTPGTKLVLADALSRAPLNGPSNEKMDTRESRTVMELIDSLPISRKRLERLKAAMVDDAVALTLLKYITRGWPHRKGLEPGVAQFSTFREELTAVEGIIFYRNRVFVPELERERVLADIHRGHQGETKCVARATSTVWWPGMTAQVREIVKKCAMCEQHRTKPREPLVSTPLPERPWWRLATDIFEKEGVKYLLVVDYYSRYITVQRLGEDSSAAAVIDKLEGLFSLLGVPSTLVSDGGPQFMSKEFQQFLQRCDVVHLTSSPRYPQSNGEAERAVRTVKDLWKKNVNLRTALCAYRDTPLANGYTPAELMLGRSLNSMGISPDRQLDVKRLRQVERLHRDQRAVWYNTRYRTRDRPPLEVGQPVEVRDPNGIHRDATVVVRRGREVVVHEPPDNLLRRNRAHVHLRAPSLDSSPECLPESGKEPPVVLAPEGGTTTQDPAEAPSDTGNAAETPGVVAPGCRPGARRRDKGVVAPPPTEPPSPGPQKTYITRTGRVVKPPDRLNL